MVEAVAAVSPALPATAAAVEPRTTLGPCTVDVVRDYPAFLALEAEWNEVVDRAAIGHPFLRHEWIRTWWDCFGGGMQLHVVVVRADGRIIAIAPLMRETAHMYGVPVRRIRLLQNDHTPRADVIVAERADEAYQAIWRTLLAGQDRWDVLQLNQLPKDCGARTRVPGLAADTGFSSGVWPSGDSPFLELAGAWDQYQASLPAKFRSNLRNRLSRLTKIGEPAVEVLTDGDAIKDACADAWRLESSGWKSEAGTAIASDPAVNRFYSLLAERATERGWLRLMFLTVGGKRIATSYGACYRNRLFLFKTGYDPEFATCAPFKLLTFFAIRDAYAEGLSEVDFLGDAEPWKLEWTTTTRSHDWLFVFSDTRRARFLHSVKFQVMPELKKWRA